MANGSSYTLNIKALFDASSVKAGVNEIQNSLKNLKLPDKLATDLNSSFTNVNKALDDFTSKVEKGIKTKGDANGITKSFENVTKELTKLDNLMIKVKGQLGEGVDLTQMVKFDETTTNKLKEIGKEVDDLQKKINSINTEKLNKFQTAFDKIKKGGATGDAAKKALDLFKEGDLEGALQILNQIETKLKSIKAANETKGNDTTNIENSIKQIGVMKNAIAEAQQGTADLVDQQNKKIAEGGQVAKQYAEKVANGFHQQADALHEGTQAANENRKAIVDLTARQQQFVSEVDQIKSRIQYFFGLANAINLVKRAVRGAVDTIKELDKAMTETAVVTDYTVKDMWSQLPEYTKRANELGVTTKDAYESATLYFQQGLNADQAAALSTETLKMARIAGLDAAEATDRMTNALRGFNMALDEQSAQRVDDVYSQLAAHTASNVDEISTAMTKVASLAHNANMEFETTAAFLAQIIETTRESAETAGTALKTVVARFSEVKKLVDEGTLKGTDEEGQAIDVNKVGAALRTAGIDLNKYFLGEVGLDDIFVELASKWDSLTAVQQRYIATQAAGSRQQSRFIALMQDYARTQELVSMAYDAEGASAKQFEKTQKSLQSKLARLKNAWDQFLMGITNNVMVKTFVDVLTDILNFINKLTSAFGDGAGAVLKFATAFGGLMGMRGLFVNGGIATRAIGAFLGSGIVGQKFGVSAGLGRMVDQEGGGQIYQAFTGQELKQQRRGVNIFGGVGNVGKGLWNGAQLLGTWAGTQNGLLGKAAGGLDSFIMKKGAAAGLSGAKLAGLASGLTGITTAIAGIGLAIGAAVAAYQLWLHLTPEGQLKKAKKEAEKLKKESEKADKELKSKQSFQDTYKEQTTKVENATTAADRQAAIQERNEAILSAIEEDGSLAKYVITERTDFGIELTIDEKKFATAIEDAKKAAQDAEINSGFADARTAAYQANVAKKDLLQLYRTYFIEEDPSIAEAMSVDEIYEKLIPKIIDDGAEQKTTDKAVEDAAKYYQDYTNNITSARKQAEITYGEYLTQAGAGKDLTNALIPVLGDVFTKTGKQLNLDQINKLINQDESTLIKMAEIYSGVGEFFEQDLSGIDTENFDLATLGLDAETLKTFGDLVGYDSAEIEKHIKAQIDATAKIQKQKKTNIYEAALRNGISLDTKKGFGLDIAKLPPALTSIIDNLIPSLEEALSSEDFAGLLPQLVGMGEEQLAQFSNFFANFDLSNPINAFHQLNEAKQEAMSLPEGDPYRQMLSNIEKANVSIFDTGNLVQSFLTSTSYDSLTSSIQDFIKANKKLTADNIEELAKSCSDLQNLLEDTTATAQGLAAAFSLFENDEAPIDALTSSLIAALSAGEDFETLMGNVSKWIKEFDEGTDMKEGTEHILDLAEKATDYIYNWEFGNQPLENIYNHIFGEGKNGKGAYYDYMLENWGKLPIDEIETKLQGDIDRIKSLAENAGRGALDELINNPLDGGLTGKVTDLGNGEYTWDLDAYDSANDAIQDVAKNLGVADDAARGFIESWASHMWGMRQAWNELNFKDKIKALSDSLSENNIITQQELDVLGKETGKTAQEVLDAVNTLRKGTSEPVVIKVKWTDDKGQNLSGGKLFTEVKNVLRQLDSGYDELTEKFSTQRYVNGYGLTDLGINYQNLSDYLTNSLKLSDSQAKEVANNIASQTGKNLTQDIQVPITLNDGSIKMQTETIVAETVEELESAIESRKLETQYRSQAKIYADAIKEAFTDTELNLDASGAVNAAKEAIKAVSEYIKTVEEANKLTLTGGDNTSTEQPTTGGGKTQKNLDDTHLAAPNMRDLSAASNEVKSAASAAAGSVNNIASAASTVAGGMEAASQGAQGLVSGLAQGKEAANQVDKAVEDIPDDVNVKVAYDVGEYVSKVPATETITVKYNVEGAPIAKSSTGGLVGSYAKGSENFHVKPGTALTGEEGPEIIWNKNEGYAYVTGSDGPEFQDLRPGDRVFNASETKKIFKNSSVANGGKVKSYADDPRGGWNDRSSKSKKGSGGKDKDKTSAEWKNELDWLYNLMENIVELERDQKKLEEEYEDILTDQAKTSKDLYSLLIERLGNLNAQLDRQTLALQKREQEMREFMDTTNDKDQYLWYNWNDRTIEIDWDKIEAIKDEEEYKHIKDLVSEAEAIQDKMDDAEDAITDIENQIQELENIWRDTYVDFEKRVLDALVQSYQDVIDNYSELNETLNNTNDEILNAIQQQIDLERQIRDNTETEDDISQKEARLAYLQRDTTGANATEILKLQEELENSRQDYEDTLVDQALQRLQEDNDAAAKQREQQIEFMQAQLEYSKKNGDFNDKVTELLTGALSTEGTLITTSDLRQLLIEEENWKAMSDINKEIWEEELNKTFKEVGAQILKENAGDVFSTKIQEMTTSILERFDTLIGSKSQSKTKNTSSKSSGSGGGGSDKTPTKPKSTPEIEPKPNAMAKAGGGYEYDRIGVVSTKKDTTADALKKAAQTTEEIAKTIKNMVSNANPRFATGGLNTYTGLAWLDGTPSEPEYVLNARQTQAFLKLADVLPNVMSGNTQMNGALGGNIYLDLDMHVDEIGSDYDVDRIANRVKDIIYDASSYRNVNTINFIR